MRIDARQYSMQLEDSNISVIYSGPIWADGIDGIAEMLLRRLEYDEMPLSASQAIFSVFVEQMNNMMMYSAEKEKLVDSKGKQLEISKGIFILGITDTTYYIKTGNVVTPDRVKILKERIDFLNSLDRHDLRLYFKERIREESGDIGSKGAGIGLIEVARRSTAPIEYEFEPYKDGLQYFTMNITIEQGEQK